MTSSPEESKYTNVPDSGNPTVESTSITDDPRITSLIILVLGCVTNSP
tara:strand:- start:155 stop:298 length:144 start_codon:yes stop_codon:yes gene_type:complete